MLRIFAVALLLAATLCAGKPKNTGPFKNENQSVEISATPILDREEIKELVGSDLEGHYILVNVTVTPKFGGQVDIHRDDFMLKTDKDGERTAPFVASQIAGKGRAGRYRKIDHRLDRRACSSAALTIIPLIAAAWAAVRRRSPRRKQRCKPAPRATRR